MKLLSGLFALSSIASVSVSGAALEQRATEGCDEASFYPKIKLPKGAFDLEGYAKDNPIGPVTGGGKAPTVTITAGTPEASASLIAAANVRDPEIKSTIEFADILSSPPRH